MKHIDLFSGIGGFALACQWEGIETIAHSEIEPFPCKVYHRHFPNSECLGDITKIDWKKYLEQKQIKGGDILITGGFPCQPHSIAGKRKASKDSRDLWGECFRAISEIRPRYALFENVPALLISDSGRFFNRVLSDIHKSGYNAEWSTISAAAFGAPHLRERLWIISYPRGKRMEGHIKKSVLEESHVSRRQVGVSFPEIPERFNSFESRLCRSLYGLPNGVDRVRGLGNAIVPQVARWIIHRIRESQ